MQAKAEDYLCRDDGAKYNREAYYRQPSAWMSEFHIKVSLKYLGFKGISVDVEIVFMCYVSCPVLLRKREIVLLYISGSSH